MIDADEIHLYALVTKKTRRIKGIPTAAEAEALRTAGLPRGTELVPIAEGYFRVQEPLTLAEWPLPESTTDG